MYTKHQQAEIIRQYFQQAGAEEAPQCPLCGEPLQIQCGSQDLFGLQVEVSCRECGKSFLWAQPQPEREWKKLHLGYFLERYASGERMRCPLDDCFVSYAEFSDGVVQFNCPYCNRRGKVRIQG
ncbi:MAG: hypothetical protein ACE5JX_02615 [Acidobacteriota bacterium]